MSELKVSELPLQKQLRYYTFKLQIETLIEKHQYESVIEVSKDLFLQFLFKDVLIEQLMVGLWNPEAQDFLSKIGFMGDSTNEG
jgi:hypothetical protein